MSSKAGQCTCGAYFAQNKCDMLLESRPRGVAGGSLQT
uniref:Uncharacterized protein n=1 Tax=Setaria viridis TaxID=4556 RepID=A0A4U6TGA5_SETVI|nr:hypothetical protein SEVIR_8G053750v2 [Setaria viridis]